MSYFVRPIPYQVVILRGLLEALVSQSIACHVLRMGEFVGGMEASYIKHL